MVPAIIKEIKRLLEERNMNIHDFASNADVTLRTIYEARIDLAHLVMRTRLDKNNSAKWDELMQLDLCQVYIKGLNLSDQDFKEFYLQFAKIDTNDYSTLSNKEKIALTIDYLNMPYDVFSVAHSSSLTTIQSLLNRSVSDLSGFRRLKPDYILSIQHHLSDWCGNHGLVYTDYPIAQQTN